MRTEKSRLRRSLMSLQDLLRRIRHLSVREQVNTLNAALRGHYAYYGIAGNFRSLQKVHRAVRTLLAQNAVQPELGRTHHVEHVPLDQTAATDLATKAVPSLSGGTSCCESSSEERSAGNPHATFCGNRERATASGDPVRRRVTGTSTRHPRRPGSVSPSQEAGDFAILRITSKNDGASPCPIGRRISRSVSKPSGSIAQLASRCLRSPAQIS